MKSSYFLLALFVIGLVSCARPARIDYNWDSCNQPPQAELRRIDAEYSITWMAIKEAGKNISMTIVTEDQSSGLIAFTKEYKRWNNTSYQLTVIVSKLDENTTGIKMRGFIYSTMFGKPYDTPNVFPSDGRNEQDFIKAVDYYLEKWRST